jgi:NAD(P)-dependent dehydrogenase (short-subunit alcohol dehydrogenase family)
MTMSLEGRVALVTGAARGIGRATAQRLAAEGATVVACDLAEGHGLDTMPYELSASSELAATAESIESAGGKCLTVTADVRRSGELRAAADRAVAELGRLDILVSCAGISSFATLLEMSDETWDQMISVNLTGAANAIRAVAPHMVSAGYGRIVVVGSTAGKRGAPSIAHYTAAKWGVQGLVKSASLELVPAGITVNVVNPGPTDTIISTNPAVAAYVQSLASAGMQSSSESAQLIPPQAIADAVAFLVSDAAAHISGTALDVADGRNAAYTA